MTGLSRERLDQHLPDGPVTSLRRVQTMYGALEEAAGSEEVGGDPEFALYYTPGELDEFVTEDPSQDDRYLVTVEVDLTDDGPGLEDVDVEIRPLTPALVSELGFARYPWGRGIDHSITRRGAKGGSDADTVATYCIECIERWTNADGREKAVGEVAESHPDGWVIETLQRLGRDDAVSERIRSRVSKGYTSEGRVVATVRLRLAPDDLDCAPADASESWFYPGSVHVLNAGMKARKDQKLSTKNTDAPSRGTSACMVTGTEEDVFGTVEDPLAFFTIQHAEKFDGLEKTNSWRSHPVSADAALLMQSGASLIEACRRTRYGLGVYALPYFVEVNFERAETLYGTLDDLRDREFDDVDEHPIRWMQSEIENRGDESDARDLRFYVISLRNDSGDINVLHEAPDASLYWPRQVGAAQSDVLHRSSAFGLAGGFEFEEDWQPITPTTGEKTVVNQVVSGRYAWGTMPLIAGDDGAMSDDPVEWLTYQLLSGEPVPVDRLIDGYVDRMEQERRRDEEGRFPENHVKAQFAQLEALARAGLLESNPDSSELTTSPKTMDDQHPTREEVAGDGDLSRLKARRYRLERFIEDRPSLTEDEERKDTFLAGVVVGMLSTFQQTNRDMNRTVAEQYPADQITGDRLATAWPELVNKAGLYASDVDWADETLFPEVFDEWTGVSSGTETPEDGTASAFPLDWNLPIREVRFFYALGLAYGRRADKRAYDLVQALGDEPPEEAATAADGEAA